VKWALLVSALGAAQGLYWHFLGSPRRQVVERAAWTAVQGGSIRLTVVLLNLVVPGIYFRRRAFRRSQWDRGLV
jgi:hypothetical protein